MAGDWIKVEVSTLDKPEVLRISRILGIDRDAAFGKLVRLWAWFDENSVDGVVDGVVSTDVDEICRQEGFAAACRDVGWLDYDDTKERIELPNFDRHNGKTAKKRALKNRRQESWRRNGGASVDTPVDARASTTASTREEKRRDTPNGGAAPHDLRKQIFDHGVQLLGSKSRSLIGKAVKEVGEKKVAEVIGSMMAKPPAGDAVEYFVAATKREERGFVC